MTLSILDQLTGLEEAAAEIAHSWRPDDPAYQADMYRQIMMNLSYAYFVYFHADAEHPDWTPLWNPVYLQQPNPDDIYLYCPIRGDLTYRISGNRGTCRRLIFNTMAGFTGMVDDISEISDVLGVDDRDLGLASGEDFEVIFSAERPARYAGKWARISPKATGMMLRYRSWDWANEIDPRLSIECLDRVGPKPRLTPQQVIERIHEMAKLPARFSKLFLPMQDGTRQRAGVNAFEFIRHPGIKQVYWAAAFEFKPNEALIIETEIPKVAPYWNIQLNDPYFNAVEYVYRLGSTNGGMAKVDSDGKLRAVISLEDPGVPNWLDPGGYTEGTIYGRWYECDTEPLPTIECVPLAKVRDHLPTGTPVVTQEQRAEQIRERVRAAQRRRRW
jgi:hypothetical protein